MSNGISRVEKEFIFNFLMKNKIKLELKYIEETIEIQILDQSLKELKIELSYVPDSIKKINTEVNIFFYFQNTHHTFKSNILKLQGHYAIIKNPDIIVRNLQRKYERVSINGKYSVEFEFHGEIVPLDYPTTRISYFPDKSPVNADFSDVKIEDLLKKFKEKMSPLVSVNRIIMLRNYEPKNQEEKLLIHYGKILYINNSHSDLITKQLDQNLDLILKQDWINYELEINKISQTAINKTLSDYQVNMSKRDIFSEALIPVLYRNYVVAIIYLANDHKRSAPIDMKILNYSYQFSRILSYTLKQSGYFKAEEGKKEKISIPINDMSPGGLGFTVDGNVYEDKLLLDHNYRLFISINNRPVRILAKLVRKFQNLSKHSYGFMFIEIKKEDSEFLNRLLNIK